jgi:dienelactone hydrolase
VTDRSRRRVLVALATGTAGLVAGCGSDGAASSPTGTATDAATPTATGPPPTAPSADDSELTRRVREVVAAVNDGAVDSVHDRFVGDLAEQVSPVRLEQVWAGQESALGQYRSVSGFQVQRRDGRAIVTATLAFENGRRRLIVGFDGTGIDTFLIRPAQTEWTSPAYANESRVTERTLELTATAGCTLGATLTVPDDVATAPGVVIVHGQGPSDRDGTFGPNRPYKDLAWGLASNGVAVLRYEKRLGTCDVNMAEASIDDVVTDDALTAVAALRETDVVPDDEVVLAGHSIGGTLAPRIAKRDGDLAGIVMLAALHRAGADAIVAQNEFLANRDGTVTDAEREGLAEVRTLAERIRTLDVPDDEVLYLGGDEYWGSLQAYDHDATAQALAIPQLYLNGARDYQVTVDADLAGWRNALAGESAVSFQTYPSLNHLFMPGSGTPGRAEYLEENHVAETVVTDVEAFVSRATTGTTEGD